MGNNSFNNKNNNIDTNNIVQEVWNYCNVLRDDGFSYQDYLEQLTYLLFLKMEDESQTNSGKIKIPHKLGWQNLRKLSGEELEKQYRNILEELGKMSNSVGTIYKNAESKFKKPARLERLVKLIDGKTWLEMGVDKKGEIYEGLLQKNAEDVKSGAGQYFTPRELIKVMVEVMKPKPGITINDPACGTGGFLLAAYNFITKNYSLNPRQKKFLSKDVLSGTDIAEDVARLCLMNLFLHGIGNDESPIKVDDALLSDSPVLHDMVLTNPPFGKKSSYTVTSKDGKVSKEVDSYERDKFWVTTSNKQLNFVQHVKSLLKDTGKAAVVVPDNVLFEGGAGETVRRKLLETCDVHTLLRLPTGLFYAQGVKANVLFFDNKPGSKDPWTKKLWIYDFRTNKHFTLKQNQLRYEDLEDFIECYNPQNRHQRKESERFRAFKYEELIQRDKISLDIFWLKDDSLEDSENLPDPDTLAQEISDNLESAQHQFQSMLNDFENISFD